MSYFTAVMARTDEQFRILDLALEDVTDLGELADLVDGAGDGSADGDAVVVLEHEDAWFAFIRVSGNDAVVFISDAEAAGASPYAELFADYLDSRADEYEEEVDPVLDDDDDVEDDDAEEEPQMLDFDEMPAWAGDADIFAADGVAAAELLEQLEEHSSDPARVVAHVGEEVGFAEVLEGAR